MRKILIIALLCLVITGASLVVYSQSSGLNIQKSDISIDDAKDKVKKFIEQPSAEIDYKTIKYFPSITMYELNTNNCTFYVNTKTGDVQYAFYENSILNSKEITLNMDNAEKIAYQYAMKKYSDFSKKNMILVNHEMLDHGDVGKEYLFEWKEQLDGVYTQNSVIISVNPNTGEIISYIGNHDAVNISLSPVISQTKAIETAKLYAQNIFTPKIESKLQIVYVEGNLQKLAWVIEINGKWDDGTIAYEIVYIDAENGKVIS